MPFIFFLNLKVWTYMRCWLVIAITFTKSSMLTCSEFWFVNCESCSYKHCLQQENQHLLLLLLRWSILVDTGESNFSIFLESWSILERTSNHHLDLPYEYHEMEVFPSTINQSRLQHPIISIPHHHCLHDISIWNRHIHPLQHNNSHPISNQDICNH